MLEADGWSAASRTTARVPARKRSSAARRWDAYASQVYIDKHAAIVQAVANAMRKSFAWLAEATPSSEQVAETVPADLLMGDRKLYIGLGLNFAGPPRRRSCSASMRMAPE
jgi:hypothetical protein